MHELLLTTNTSSSKINIGQGEIQNLRSYIDEDTYDYVFCIVDKTVFNIYGNVIKESLTSPTSSYRLDFAIIESLESNKNLATIEKIFDKVSDCSCSKSTLFVAIGGGIACDMTGLIAGLWYRGCDAMYVPTTLLAMVDASVGGKCGIDFKGHKNQLGLIIQPKQVVIDPVVLGTLKPKTFKDGCAEIIKHACIADAKLFSQLKVKPLRISDKTEDTIVYNLKDEELCIPSHHISYSVAELEKFLQIQLH